MGIKRTEYWEVFQPRQCEGNSCSNLKGIHFIFWHLHMERIALLYILYMTNTVHFCAIKITKLKQTLSYSLSCFQKILSVLIYSSSQLCLSSSQQYLKTLNCLILRLSGWPCNLPHKKMESEQIILTSTSQHQTPTE